MTKIPVFMAALGFLLANIPGVISSSIPRSIAHSRILPIACDVKAEYDYVIVGGGTSGLTVADRLTESGERKFVSEEEKAPPYTDSVTFARYRAGD